MRIREERRVLFNQHKWKEAEAHFLISLPVILDRVKHGQEKWISRLWLRLRVQWNTTNTKRMAQAMTTVMTQPQSSILYSLISFSNSTIYDGMVQERPGTARMTEHATATSDTHPVELKYRGMRAAGGAAAWYFIPVVAGAAVPKRQLAQLEDIEIGSHHKSWNKVGKNDRPHLRALRLHRHKAEKPTTRIVRLESYIVDGGKLTLETDTDRLAMSDTFMLHSSRARLRTGQTRKYGRSETTATVLLSSDIHTGTLRSAMRWASKRRDDWVIFTVNKRRTRVHRRTSHYRRMEAIAVVVCRELDDVCATLSVYDLYALHWTSRRLCRASIHIRNTGVIERELWSRGFLVRPEGSMVMKLPPTARVSILEARIAFRQTMVHSNLTDNLVAPLMYALRIVEQSEQQLGRALDTTKLWINSGQESCTCHLYPSSWPRRHGHIFIPSWEYQGPFKQTMTAIMSSTVRSLYSPTAFEQAQYSCWKRYLPLGLLGEIFKYDMPYYPPEVASHPLSSFRVRQLKTYLEDLVTMGIDKCRNRKLVLCPMLFWQKYRSTFPVQDDPVHFERITLSVDDYADWLKKEYDRNRWFKIATWHRGSPPIPYNLWKLKDIITPCEKVMASKGKCCRQRPISPNTHHWCRRVFKRVGSVLRLVCLSLPRSSVNFIRSQDLLQYIQEWNGSVDPEEVTRVILHVGDIANCYDELNHDDCLDGVAWALSKMPQWHRPTDRPRRIIDRYSVDRFSRKDITVGPDLSYERTRIELSTTQVLSVCEFDIRNSILCIDGVLWKRLLGAPMGGFLSAFYAMLNFAYVEHKCVMPMFTKMGIPGGVKRYMDDIIVALLCRNPEEVTAATAFVTELNKPTVYPPPLCLNMEPQGNQEFLECNVVVSGNQLALSLNNKVVVDALYRQPPYRQRLSSKVSNAANRSVLHGILTRIMQSTNSDELIVTGVLALQYETRHYKIKDSLLGQVVSQAQTKARERNESNVERALAKANQAIAK